MKNLVITIAMVFAFGITMAGENKSSIAEQSGSFTLNIEGLTSDNGLVKVLLYNNELGFPTEEQYAFINYNLDLGKDCSSATIQTLPFGSYAIYVYHDENGNEKFDKNWAGNPKEAYGYSNMQKESIVNPAFSQSLFTFSQDGQTLKIDLVHSKKGKDGALTNK